MAHLLSRAPPPDHRPKEGELLLSSLTHVALQVDAQRRLLRTERARSRRGKKGQKKQPQRGLGVAQLEKIRLEEQRQAEEHLAALRQLQHQGRGGQIGISTAGLLYGSALNNNNDLNIIGINGAGDISHAAAPGPNNNSGEQLGQRGHGGVQLLRDPAAALIRYDQRFPANQNASGVANSPSLLSLHDSARVTPARFNVALRGLPLFSCLGHDAQSTDLLFQRPQLSTIERLANLNSGLDHFHSLGSVSRNCLQRSDHPGNVETNPKQPVAGIHHTLARDIDLSRSTVNGAIPPPDRSLVQRQIAVEASTSSKVGIPPPSLERMMELSSFQSMHRDASSAGAAGANSISDDCEQMQAGRIKRRACALVPENWRTPSSTPTAGAFLGSSRSFAVNDDDEEDDGDHDDLAALDPGSFTKRDGCTPPSKGEEVAGAEDSCALSLRPPGTVRVETTLSLHLDSDVTPLGRRRQRLQGKDEEEEERKSGGESHRNFLSLAIPTSGTTNSTSSWHSNNVHNTSNFGDDRPPAMHPSPPTPNSVPHFIPKLLTESASNMILAGSPARDAHKASTPTIYATVTTTTTTTTARSCAYANLCCASTNATLDLTLRL